MIALEHGIHRVLGYPEPKPFNLLLAELQLTWFCRIPLLPSKVRYLAVCLKDRAMGAVIHLLEHFVQVEPLVVGGPRHVVALGVGEVPVFSSQRV